MAGMQQNKTGETGALRQEVAPFVEFASLPVSSQPFIFSILCLSGIWDVNQGQGLPGLPPWGDRVILAVPEIGRKGQPEVITIHYKRIGEKAIFDFDWTRGGKSRMERITGEATGNQNNGKLVFNYDVKRGFFPRNRKTEAVVEWRSSEVEGTGFPQQCWSIRDLGVFTDSEVCTFSRILGPEINAYIEELTLD